VTVSPSVSVAVGRPPAPAPSEAGAFDVQGYLRSGPLAEALAPRAGGLTADRIAERAVAESPLVAAKEAQIQAAAAQLDQTMIAFLPQITARAGYTRLSKAKISFASPGGVLVTGDGAPGATDPARVLGPCMDNPFNFCAYNTDTGASAGQINLLAYGPTNTVINIPLNSYSLQAQLAVPISDYILSLLPAKRGSETRRDAVALARDAERVKVETDARLAYYNWLRTVAAVVAVEDSLRRVKARQVDVENLFQAGSATKAEVLRLSAQIAQIEQAINDARALRTTTEQALAIMVDDQNLSFTPGEDVIDLPADLGDPGPLDALIREAHTRRLEIKSMEKSVGAIDYGIKATRAGYFPRLDGFADALYANPNQRFFPLAAVWRGSWSLGVQLTYSLNSSLRTRAEIREYKANKRELMAQIEALRRGIAMEVTQAYLARNKAIADIELSARSLEAAVEAYRVASELFTHGSATTNDIIDAEADQLTAILRIVNSRIDLRSADARLRYATGRVKPNPVAVYDAQPAATRRRG
jgi:outer membrane protein TolC